MLQAICGLPARSWHREMAQVTSSVQGGRDMGADSPVLAQTLIILMLEKWLKSEAKCHIVRPLKSGLKGKQTIARVFTVPNPLKGLKLS